MTRRGVSCPIAPAECKRRLSRNQPHMLRRLRWEFGGKRESHPHHGGRYKILPCDLWKPNSEAFTLLLDPELGSTSPQDPYKAEG